METKNTPATEVAPQEGETQSEQVVDTEKSTDSPEAVSDQEEKLFAGKFKSVEELEKSYQELQPKFTRTAQEKAELERILQSSQQTPAEVTPDLDPEVVPALDKWYSDRRNKEIQAGEIARAREFKAKHADELTDPVLDGTVLRLMQEARQNQTYLDQEDALAQAKKLLDERIKPQVREAQIQGEKEAMGIAQKRAEFGKIGETTKSQKMNPDELSADEFAKYFNIPRA
jgi:hypothetical protein